MFASPAITTCWVLLRQNVDVGPKRLTFLSILFKNNDFHYLDYPTRFRKKILKLRVCIKCVADVDGIQGMYLHEKLSRIKLLQKNVAHFNGCQKPVPVFESVDSIIITEEGGGIKIS